MSVRILPGREVSVSLPEPLFDLSDYTPELDDYAPSRDGQRFLVKLPVEPLATQTPLQLISNWDRAEELLTEIVADMETEQSREEQTQKSEGVGTKHAMQASGRLHADARIGHDSRRIRSSRSFGPSGRVCCGSMTNLEPVPTFQAFDGSTRRLTRRSLPRLCDLPPV